MHGLNVEFEGLNITHGLGAERLFFVLEGLILGFGPREKPVPHPLQVDSGLVLLLGVGDPKVLILFQDPEFFNHIEDLELHLHGAVADLGQDLETHLELRPGILVLLDMLLVVVDYVLEVFHLLFS